MIPDNDIAQIISVNNKANIAAIGSTISASDFKNVYADVFDTLSGIPQINGKGFLEKTTLLISEIKNAYGFWEFIGCHVDKFKRLTC